MIKYIIMLMILYTMASNAQFIERYEDGSVYRSTSNKLILEFFESGALKEMTYMSGEKKHGIHYEYYSNGSIKVIAHYVNDILDGEYTRYHACGHVYYYKVYLDGLPIHTSWDDDFLDDWGEE